MSSHLQIKLSDLPPQTHYLLSDPTSGFWRSQRQLCIDHCAGDIAQAEQLLDFLRCSTTHLLRKFHFLKLPTEIRNSIYEYVLQQHRPLSHANNNAPDIQETPLPICGQHTSGSYPPALAQTCTTVRREVLPMWYDRVRIKVEIRHKERKQRICRKRFEDWVDRLEGEDAVSMIRHLIVKSKFGSVSFELTENPSMKTEVLSVLPMLDEIDDGPEGEQGWALAGQRMRFQRECREVQTWFDTVLTPELESGERLTEAKLRRLVAPFMAVRLRLRSRRRLVEDVDG